MSYKLKDICEEIGVEYNGKDIEIDGLKTLADAGSSDLSFFNSQKYIKQLPLTKAAAVLIEDKYKSYLPKNVIPLITDEPYLKLALASKLFAHKITVESSKALLAEGAQVDPSAHFGKDVKVGKNSVIMAGAYIGDGVEIGDNSIIYPNAVVYHGCKIGNDCIIHSGAVIGSDGYGFAHTKDGHHVKIYQIGNVVIEDDVEIGSNSTIDRAALGSTIIRRGTKIDNLVQIGHNCVIGENSLIVSQTGLSGSTTLGRNVVMGGQSATAGHLEIGDFTQIAARGAVTKSLEGHKIYGGAPAVDIRLWKRMQAVLMRLSKKR